MQLTALTLAEAADRIKRKDISPCELIRDHLARIERIEPLLNSFITLTEENALQEAQEAEAAILRGEYRGPLHGIPIAIKDAFETQGVRTTAGTKFLADYVPATDSTVVQRLKAAGAISLGKNNLHEWAMGTTTMNLHFGPCQNPWNLDCVPGGSSGGSAAALAAELCMGSVGTDTGGSIRNPSSLCGTVGIKPTHGRVSVRGVIPLSWSLDHTGPMARRVRDCAILLQAIAGYDPDDPFSVNIPTDDYVINLEGGVKGWRVGLARGEHFTEGDPDVIQAVRGAARVFEQLGAHVEEADLQNSREARMTNPIIIAADAAAFHAERVRTRPDDFDPDILARLRKGAAYTAIDYALARQTQKRLRRQFERFFDNYNILLTPTTPIAAPNRNSPDFKAQRESLPHFVAPFNITGLPALSVPCGFTREGLPIGLQIVGRPWSEAQVLRAGYAYEQATEWHLRKPTALA